MDEFSKWLLTRPKKIQDMAREYPPGEYIIKGGAPYGICRPGTKVALYSYLENGEVGVVIKAENKTPEAIVHENMLSEKYGKSEEETKDIHKEDVLVHIDPKWLQAIN